MQSQILREIGTVDENHQLHLDLKIPDGFAKQVEVLILPIQENIAPSAENLAVMKMTDETDFVKTILASEEEECWDEALK